MTNQRTTRHSRARWLVTNGALNRTPWWSNPPGVFYWHNSTALVMACSTKVLAVVTDPVRIVVETRNAVLHRSFPGNGPVVDPGLNAYVLVHIVIQLAKTAVLTLDRQTAKAAPE